MFSVTFFTFKSEKENNYYSCNSLKSNYSMEAIQKKKPSTNVQNKYIKLSKKVNCDNF